MLTILRRRFLIKRLFIGLTTVLAGSILFFDLLTGRRVYHSVSFHSLLNQTPHAYCISIAHRQFTSSWWRFSGEEFSASEACSMQILQRNFTSSNRFSFEFPNEKFLVWIPYHDKCVCHPSSPCIKHWPLIAFDYVEIRKANRSGF